MRSKKYTEDNFPFQMKNEELVKTVLKTKLAIEEFFDVDDRRQMESLNKTVRGLLSRIRHLEEEEDEDQSQLPQLRKSFREANLKCIRRIEAADKELLFHGYESDDNDYATTRRRKRNNDDLIKEASSTTDSLTAISRQLAATVERSAATVDELAASSATVVDTKDEFKNMGAVIGQSRKLITKYGRRETTDRVLIFFAFCFFFAVVFYILRKRVLGPLDPFSLAWNFVVGLIRAVIQLLGY